jgi:hypothetical protein
MKGLRIMIGLAVALMASALAVAPAYASKEKPKVPTGNFIAEINGTTISPEKPAIAKSNNEGEVEEFKFAGIKGIQCKENQGGSGGITSTSKVESEKSPDLKMDLKFNHCRYPIKAGVSVRKMPFRFKQPLHMVLHANGSVKILTIEENETEVKIPPFKCVYKIPQQEIPLSAEKKEGEFEAVEYSTEVETTEKLKKYPKGFFNRLEVEFTGMKHLKAEFKPEAGDKENPPEKCGYVKGEEGQFNPETGMVETTWGFEGFVEEIEIKGGSIGFEPA